MDWVTISKRRYQIDDSLFLGNIFSVKLLVKKMGEGPEYSEIASLTLVEAGPALKKWQAAGSTFSTSLVETNSEFEVEF
jgi:hypothetical protein